jgi:RNA polymerase sigma-70 factor (ECF subfamily)
MMGYPTGPDGVTDEEILRRVQRGETKLFGLIFERYYRRIEPFLKRLGVPDDELEDLLADVFARAFERSRSFDPDHGTRYIAYLYTIARNLAIDRLRERGRMPETVILDEAWQEPDRQRETPLEAVLRKSEIEQIRRAISHLTPSDREIITLSYERGLSCREIMVVMGKPSVTAVTTHLYKAMKRLRELVHNANAEREPRPCAGAR